MVMHPVFYLRGIVSRRWVRIQSRHAAKILIGMADHPNCFEGWAIIARLEPMLSPSNKPPCSLDRRPPLSPGGVDRPE